MHDLEEPADRAPLLASSFAAPACRSTEADLLAFFDRWREAWMTRNFDAHIAYYAPAFSGNNPCSLRWQTRHHRMVQGKSDQATLSFGTPSLEIHDNGRAQLSFSQHFEDGVLAENGTKQWQLRHINGRWLIEQEIFERRTP
jgi:hypothetical protein